jgi:hypothetical protein
MKLNLKNSKAKIQTSYKHLFGSLLITTQKSNSNRGIGTFFKLKRFLPLPLLEKGKEKTLL